MAVKIYNVNTNGMRIGPNDAFLGPQPTTDAGVYFPEYGGYYAGANIVVDGTEYAIIVSPKEGGEASSIQWKTNNTVTSGTFSTYNGKLNLQNIIDANALSSHPAMNFCNNLNINGFTDWHLPSPDELEVCYRYLKPSPDNNFVGVRSLHNELSGYNPNSNPTKDGYATNSPQQTTVTEFQEGGSQAFFDSTTPYHTSAQLPVATNAVYTQRFKDGLQSNFSKTSTFSARAVRWVEV